MVCRFLVKYMHFECTRGFRIRQVLDSVPQISLAVVVYITSDIQTLFHPIMHDWMIEITHVLMKGLRISFCTITLDKQAEYKVKFFWFLSLLKFVFWLSW